MLRSISIKDVASYDETGIDLVDLKKVNFIYGSNGTGKTTISNYLADPEHTDFHACGRQWKAEPTRCLVYNKKFREDNFEQGSIPGVFTLGEASADEIREIEAKQEKLKTVATEGQQIKRSLETLEEQLRNTEKEFREKAWVSAYKEYENDFREAFQGVMKKDLFKNALIQRAEQIKGPPQSMSMLKEKASTILGEKPQNIPPISQINFADGNDIETNEIWSRKIVGTADVNIASLVQRLNMNDWVNQGRQYLQDNEICPFCQQDTVTPDFRKQLEDYFDDSFTEATKEVNRLGDGYAHAATVVLNEMESLLDGERENARTKLDCKAFEIALKTFRSELETNKERVAAKQKEPSRAVTLNDTKASVETLHKLLDDAAAEIGKHNLIVENFNSEKTNLINEIWSFVAVQSIEFVEAYEKKAKGLKKGIENVKNNRTQKVTEYRTLQAEIEQLTNNTTSVEPTVNQINKKLKHFGFVNFEIAPSEEHPNHYQLKRDDGTLVGSSLSEGEITFITILYFLQLAQGATSEADVSEQRILIIDDPISSLDSNVLFIVSTLIKGLIKEIKQGHGTIQQIILLTHNVYFHKEVSFIDGRTKVCSEVHYWLIRKKPSNTIAIPHLQENPVQSSYELLWREIREWNGGPTVSLQNTMRRIIENYFKLLGKYGDDELIEKFENKEEQEVCRSLICWINDGSHCVHDDLFIEQQDAATDHFLRVFKDIFTHTNNEGHYQMMMGFAADGTGGA